MPGAGKRADAPASAADGLAVRIWDLPTRLFHWTLALLVVAAFITVNLGGPWLRWHFLIGYTILTLLAFRLCWGLFGARHARFAHFVAGPRTLLAYLRGVPAAAGRPGHNPLGAWSVVAMLGVLAFQVGTGLFANDDIASEGPLAKLVSRATSEWLTSLHRFNDAVIIGLVALHVAAIVYYRWRRHEDLIGPMITGDKTAPPGTPASRDDARLRLLAVLTLLACAALVAWLINGPGGGPSSDGY